MTRRPAHDPESLVAAYLTGCLPGRRRRTAARHMARCEQCQAELGTMSWLLTVIGELRPRSLNEMSRATAADLLPEVARDRARRMRDA
jgi:anti-sigma factor RsiW